MACSKAPLIPYAALVLVVTVIVGQCPDKSASSEPCEEHSNCTGKQMCVNGWCCSVVGDAMACPLYSYKDFIFQTNIVDKCTTDEDCPDWRKCCQTVIGKYCLQPDVQQAKCNGGSWPVAICMDRAGCPYGHECNEEGVCCPIPRWKLRICNTSMSNEELEQLQKCESLAQCQLGENCCRTDAGYRCVPFSVKKHLRGMIQTKVRVCPLYFYDYLEENAKGMCNKDSDCPSDRGCCRTTAGKYCLLLENKQILCQDGSQPVAACQSKCPAGYKCTESLCCPA